MEGFVFLIGLIVGALLISCVWYWTANVAFTAFMKDGDLVCSNKMREKNSYMCRYSEDRCAGC